MSKILILKVCNFLERRYGAKNPSHNVVVLVSSDSSKFSQHLVFPTVVFENTTKCKIFNQQFLNSLSVEERKIFVINGEDGTIKLFIDTSVFSSNRNFRLFLSSKFNQNRPLKCVRYGDKVYQNYTEEEGEYTDEQIFMEALITNPNDDACIIDVISSLESRGSDKGHGKIEKILISFDSPSSHLPSIDSLVMKLAKPGRIKKIFVHGNFLKYHITGTGTNYCCKKGDFT